MNTDKMKYFLTLIIIVLVSLLVIAIVYIWFQNKQLSLFR